MTNNLLSNQELIAPDLSGRVADLLLQKGWAMATAESCTGGLIGAACTDLAGSSVWFDQGFITYSNAAKTAQLGVDAALIAQHGAVSQPVAEAMAQGACARAGVRAALAVTGIAGPTGGTADKPVGTVWFAWCVQGQTHSECVRFTGDRAAVRHATVRHALTRFAALLG